MVLQGKYNDSIIMIQAKLQDTLALSDGVITGLAL